MLLRLLLTTLFLLTVSSCQMQEFDKKFEGDNTKTAAALARTLPRQAAQCESSECFSQSIGKQEQKKKQIVLDL